MAPMEDERLPRPSREVVFEELEGEVVLVHLGTNRIFSLNRTGARLWQLLAAGYDAAGIRDQLAREFDVDPAELDTEISALLASLSAEKLVTDD
jgi:hypothetical protein